MQDYRFLYWNRKEFKIYNMPIYMPIFPEDVKIEEGSGLVQRALTRTAPDPSAA
jgi:hypothetical protein